MLSACAVPPRPVPAPAAPDPPPAPGLVYEVMAPDVTVRLAADGLEAQGSFTVTHAEPGLVPFSVAFGALRVREDIDVDFRLSARRTDAGQAR